MFSLQSVTYVKSAFRHKRLVLIRQRTLAPWFYHRHHCRLMHLSAIALNVMARSHTDAVKPEYATWTDD